MASHFTLMVVATNDWAQAFGFSLVIALQPQGIAQSSLVFVSLCVLVVFAMGAAEVISALLSTAR